MILKIVSFTDEGRRTENLLKAKLPCEIWISRQKDETLPDFVRDAFFKRLPLVFVSAAGIAVRAVAPFVRDKLFDSPVLVIDERGEFVIPVLSGHFGGANEIAKKIAEKLSAIPVITTATDVEQKFAVDVFARKNQLKILNRNAIKKVSSKILKDEKLSLWVNPKIKVGEDLKKNTPEDLSVIELDKIAKNAQFPDIVIDFEQNLGQARLAADTLFLSPKTLCVGIGCKKGKSFEELKDFLFAALDNAFCHSELFSASVNKNIVIDNADFSKTHEFAARNNIISNIASISSIDIKKNEIGLLTLAQFLNVPFLTFSAEELQNAKGNFSESDFVKQITGVSNVCERAAVLSSLSSGEKSSSAKLLLKKVSSNGMTIAVAEKVPEVKTW